MSNKPLLAALLLLASSGSAFAELALAAAPIYRTVTRTYDTSSYYTKGLL